MKHITLFFLLLLAGCSPFISPPPHGLDPQNAKEAAQSFNYAHHHRKYLDAQGHISGFSPRYRLEEHPHSFYTHLARHPDEISLYADLCQAIYEGRKLDPGKLMDIKSARKAIGEEKLQKIGYDVVATFKRWQQFSGALLYNQKINTLLVVFSGTSTSKDVLMDLKFLSYHTPDRHGVVPCNYNVHEGVAQALIDSLDDFTPKFFYALGKRATKKGKLTIITMGHSLGGGIALLTADYIARSKNLIQKRSHRTQNQILIQSITFGMPRIFSRKTAREVEERLGKGNIIRFWSSLDPIPAIVSALLTGSRHVGLNFRIQDSLWRSTIPFLGSHKMAWYSSRAEHAFSQYMWERQHRLQVEQQFDQMHQLYHCLQRF